jgi:hypothetical protein
MFYWQLVLFFLLFLTAVCIASPSDGDESKICFFITGPANGDGKCSDYCIKKGKAGGSCQKRRCVCSKTPSSKEDKKEAKSQSRQLLPPNIDSTLCQLYCKNREKLNGLQVNEICDCSKL